jgi:hypothetical protein
MSHVSSVVTSTYAYRGTLARLDTNGDGVLSREEIAAGERPGLLADQGTASDATASTALSGLIAKLMQLPSNGKTDLKSSQLMQPGAAAGTQSQVSYDLYRGTYGQYITDDMAM